MQLSVKNFAIAVFAMLMTTTAIHAQKADAWMLDKSHTSVNFAINHFFSKVTGNFTDFDGTFHFDPDNLKASRADFTISVASVNTNNAKRDKHLLSNDFFNAEQYPEIRFTSKKFKRVSENEFIVYGDLTIRETTKAVELPFTVLGEMEHPMMKGTLILGLALKTSINRTDYGVGTGNWAATMVVGDKTDVEINMELNRKTAKLSRN